MSERFACSQVPTGAAALTVPRIGVRRDRARGWKRRLLVALSLATLAVSAVLSYRSSVELAPVARTFTPAWTEMAQAHAASRWSVDPLPGPLGTIAWYRADGRGLRQEAAPVLPREPDHALYYLSSLHGDEAWTALLLWRTGAIPALSLAGKRDLALILEAKEPDYLEIGLKDARGIETKIPLRVVSGWAGYRIALGAFTGVDTEAVRLLLLAHSRGVEGKDANLFRIALIDAL